MSNSVIDSEMTGEEIARYWDKNAYLWPSMFGRAQTLKVIALRDDRSLPYFLVDFGRAEEEMQINVSQQLKAPIGSTRNYRVSEVVDIDGNKLIQGEVRLTRTDRGILAKGRLYTDVELSCSRCLSLFSYPLTLNIEEEYFPTIDTVTGASLPLPDEPDCFTIDEYNVLDLTEAIRQYMLLAIPMKPLCRQDCAGLCPSCGANLNKAPCNCPTKPADPLVRAE